jgi:hypothetical protein
MPFVITNNTPTGVVIGPGAPINIGVDGDLEAGDVLFVGVQHVRSGTEYSIAGSLMEFTQAHTGASFSVPMNICVDQTWETFDYTNIEPQNDYPVNGESVSLIATLTRGVTTLATETFTGYTWQTDQNIPMLMHALERIQAQSGTLSPEQADQLAAAQTNTQLTVNQEGLPGGGLVSVAQLLGANIPANLTNRHSSVLISGQGAIARGTEPYRVDALGIEWHWNTVPAGYGELLGSVQEFELRMVQWRLIDQDDSGQLFQGAVIDSNYEGVRYIWGLHQPVTVEYYISPGVVVELSFLVPAFG